MIDRFLCKCAILCIRLYRLVSVYMPRRCRFYPSCSEYSLSAFERYGFIRGIYYTLKRIAKCHPFHPGGVDELR